MVANKTLDIAIIGSGPAAFTAAIYAARENLTVKIFERASIGGLTGTISKIENFPGFSGTGADLVQVMRTQAESFGVTVAYGECTALKKQRKSFQLTIDDEPTIARSVIIATGSERRKLNIPGEDLPGISYCATCDGPLVAGKNVIVIGGGNSAVQEALFLLKYAHQVTIINRSAALTCSVILKNRIKQEPRITIVSGATPQEFLSKNAKFSALRCVVKQTPSTQDFVADFAFIFIGMAPATSFLPPEILSEDGFVRTKLNFSTDIPGIFAAGDCRYGNIKQSIVAAGEGASAAVSVSKYLESLSH